RRALYVVRAKYFRQSVRHFLGHLWFGMTILDDEEIRADDAFDFFSVDDRVFVRLECRQLFSTQRLIFELGFTDDAQTTGRGGRKRDRLFLTREHSSQGGEDSALGLVAEEAWIMLQVQTQCHLARECGTLEELDLRAPEIRVGLSVENEVFCLKNVLGSLLDADRRFRLVDRRLAEHLDRDE